GMSSMKTGLYQGTQLKQEMKINPRLYQAMDLLYMPLLDLQQHIKQEMLNNPFLDLEEPQVTEEETQVKDEQKEREKEKEQEEIDWEEILLDGFEAGGRRAEYEVAGLNTWVAEHGSDWEQDSGEPLRPFTVEEGEKMLKVIQDFDPPGIGARDLRECLLLQMRDEEMEDTLAYRIVHDYFDQL